MSVAKIVNLTGCPSVWANLSFEVGGIIESINVALGQSVTAFDFSSLYSSLGVATESYIFNPGNLGSLGEAESSNFRAQFRYAGPQSIPIPANLLNSSDLSSNVSGSQLMCLRAEGVKAALDKGCALRANIYYAKFGNQSDIITQMRKYYSASNSSSKPAYLTALSKLAAKQYTDLNNAYNAAGIGGVVTSTSSTLAGTTTGTVSDTNPSNVATNNLTDNQTMTYTDYGYRIPSIEANAQNSRAQISLIDEQFAQYMAGQYLPNLENVFANELTSINMDVKRLQVAYLKTILLPPIAGMVTGLYKQVGDAVLAGEPVVRIENNSTVYLAGVLIYRGMLSVGGNVTVQTDLFSSATPTSIPGTIVAARGDPSGDDRWAVVISCTNSDKSSNPILPLNYNFDFDDTTVTVS
jgi:hypothetical protein